MGVRQKSLSVLIRGGFAAIAAAALFSINGHAHAAAGINPQLSFEGKIVSPTGQNIADGTYNMEFKIYQDGNSSGTGSTLKWTEDRLVGGAGGVTFTSGTFQVNLGSVTAFGSSVDWNQDTLWLSLQVGNTSSCTISTNFQTDCGGDGQMTPFIRLTSTPYAMNADKLDGIDSSGFVQLGASQSGNINIGSGTITSGAVNGITIGSTVQPSSAGALTVSANGSNALTLTGGAASTWSTSSGALTLTSAAAATWSTSAGLLTVQGGGGVAIASANGTTSSNVSLKSGDASGGASGNITIDNGTFTSGTPTIAIGNSTQAHSISIGAGGTSAQAVTVGSTSSTSNVAIQGGNGSTAITLDAATSGQISIGSTNAGTINLGPVGSTNVNSTLHAFDSSAGVQALTIGSANSTSTTKIQGGSGNTGVNIVSGGNIQIGTANTTGTILILDTDSDATYAGGTTTNGPTEVDGGMFYSSTNHTFMCGAAGAWEACSGLLYSNTAASGAINNCTNACAAFNTTNAAMVPANYCQAGRVIKVNANGIYSTAAGGNASSVQFGLFYGTDGTTRGNDTQIGSSTQASAVITSANNWSWQLDFTVTCFDTTHMMVQWKETLENAAYTTAIGGITWTSTTTASTVVVTNANKGFYIFPTYSNANNGNTATIEQLTVTGT